METRRTLTVISALLAAVTTLAACASIRPPSTSPVQTRRVEEKNYQLGQQHTAYVEQAIVKVKQFVLVRSERGVMCPTTDFELTALLTAIQAERHLLPGERRHYSRW